MGTCKPLRTYQRKTVKNSFLSSSALPARTVKEYSPIESVQPRLDKSGTFNKSLNYDDPFETTFDRLAKDVVIPPLPPGSTLYNSWNGNSSESDTSNMPNIKSPKHDEFTLFAHNNASSLIHGSVKRGRKHKMPEKLNVPTSKETVSKKTRVAPKKTKAQSKTKAQRQNIKQAGKMQKRKKVVENRSNESNNKCNEQRRPRPKCDTTSSLKNATYDENDVSHGDIEHPRKKIKTYRATTPQTTVSSHLQNIKPCFVKLDDYKNWYQPNYTEKSVADEEILFHDIKRLRTNEDINEIVQKTDSPSNASDYNDIVENLKNISLKSCSVVLRDIGNYRNEKCINGHVDAHDKSIAPNSVFHDSSKSISRCGDNVKLATCGTEENKENIIKDSFVKLERLKIENFIKEDCVTSSKRKRLMVISSTPITHKRIKLSTCSVLLSPIDAKDTSHFEENCSVMAEENVLDSTSSRSDKIIRSPIAQLQEDCNFDAMDMQEQQTQILCSSQSVQIIENLVKTERMSSEEDIYIAATQEYKQNEETVLLSSLNTFAGTDQSRSLFSDATYNSSVRDTAKNDEEIDEMVSFPVDLHSKQEQLSNTAANSTDSSLRYKLPLKASTTVENEGSIMDSRHLQQSDKAQESIVVSSFKDKDKEEKREIISDNQHSLLLGDQEDQVDINTVSARKLLSQLQDSTRITTRKRRKTRCPKRRNYNAANICKRSDHQNVQLNNKTFQFSSNNEDSNFYRQSGGSNLEHLKNTSSNTPFNQVESFDTTRRYDSICKQIQKTLFLKPGKSWARSLSILININDECNLDQLSIGKGKKWRNSVRDLLDRQKQGSIESCCKGDDAALPNPDVLNTSSLDINKRKTLNSTDHGRFTKRISVRVVPIDTSVKSDVKDIPFLEAFGILTESSVNSKVSHQTTHNEQEATHDDLIRKHSTTAKDVVLKKCSQQCYLAFSKCFPNTYLRYCRKIGEGVYGEVFLYNNHHKKLKSVMKIIPIEGEELVNGERQKKFNEILSEIVIAQELSNLRLNDACTTTGFVEVKSIKCIVGKYPKKLVELWKTYDEEKTSDNDCPSMFRENQLYIALELGHGGEDLEAFVFQTADEAYALFFQIAFALAVAEQALEFEHRDLHWGNVLISRTTDKYIYYKLNGKEIRLPSSGLKVSIIDFTLSRMLYQECSVYNDLALDAALFTAHGEYQFEIYRLMRDKLGNNWQKFEPYTNILWLHYILDKMITMVRYQRRDLKIHDASIGKLKELKNLILNYDSTYDFVTNHNDSPCRRL